ncbi:MAG: hypothetical protein ACJ71B_11405 [Nitrososphaera sp.]
MSLPSRVSYRHNNNNNNSRSSFAILDWILRRYKNYLLIQKTHDDDRLARVQRVDNVRKPNEK